MRGQHLGVARYPPLRDASTTQITVWHAKATLLLTFVLLCDQVYQPNSDSFWSQDKYFGRRLDACGLRRALIQFFASGGVRSGGIIEAIIKRLKLLREAVEHQETFRFYSR